MRTLQMEINGCCCFTFGLQRLPKSSLIRIAPYCLQVVKKLNFSNSLIIQQVTTLTVFGNLILISIDFIDFISFTTP